MRMLSVLLDVRRARQRRVTLVLLAAGALLLPLFAWAAPPAARYLCPPTLVSVLLAGAALVASGAAAVWAGREAHWTLADDLSWAVALTSLSLLGALGIAPLTVGTVLYGAAAVVLSLRVPPTRLVVAASGTALLGPLTRAVAGQRGDAFWPLVFASALVVIAHIAGARATHALAYVLAEREALLTERRTAKRARTTTGEGRTVRAVTEAPEVTEAPDEVGWEALVERLRASLSTLCEGAGVAASVNAEVRGLAPPNNKMRSNVLKIAQEAANHALRDAAPTSIAITLRRGEGGLLMEVLDDGRATETVRVRRGLSSLRGRVVPLGGSAELKRADAGWVMRVKLPCEQLN